MPGSTTSNPVVQSELYYRANRIYWIYILLSLKDKKRYIGFTSDLKNRLKQHEEGKVFSTKYRRPLILIYTEGCLSEEDARRREKYLKTNGGRRFLAKRLKNYLQLSNK